MTSTAQTAMLFALLASSSQALVDEPSLIEELGPASLWVSGTVKNGMVEISLADVLAVTIRVDGETGFKVDAPTSVTRSEAWKLAKAGKPTRTPLGAKRESWHWTVTLEPLGPGHALLQIEPLTWHGAGAPRTITWRPIPITVTSLVQSARRNDLRDATGIEELPRAGHGPSALWIVAGVLLALAVTATPLFFWKWRRQRVRVGQSPEEIACYAIDRILSMNLPEKGRLGRYHAMLANVLRRYLEKTLGLPARRLTTAEVLRQLQALGTMDSVRQACLREFLERCDLAKFACRAVSPAGCRQLAERIRGWIQEAKRGGGP